MHVSSQVLDRIAVTFDDERAVAAAGLILPATVSRKLGLEAAADRLVGVGYRPGRKAATVIHAMLAGADCIDDVDLLRSGATWRVVGHEVAAPSTVGSWLRRFTFGHVRQLDRLAETLLARAWAAGAGPGDQPLTIDIDSTVCEVHGYAKQGAAFGYTGQRGYHPMLATRADTGEVLHARQRQGSANTARGADRFVRETIARVRRAGAAGPVTLRADSGYWSRKVIAACAAHGVRFSLTVRNVAKVRDAIDGIDETSWIDIDYTSRGFAQVAETGLDGYRLIVRRTKVDHPDQQLFDDWRHHAFVTDAPGDPVDLDGFHRHHAVCELAIRDLKAEGLAHTPSGVFNANAAWLVLATLAHNLLRWTARLGDLTDGALVAKTLRRRMLAMPGWLVQSGRRHTLRLPARWPWRGAFLAALNRLRALPPAAPG
jgi:hypothetical protein